MGIGVRVVHSRTVTNSLMRLENQSDYITQQPPRSATSWLPPFWECFAFKQTRSWRRWRRVCRGVKETAPLNESDEAGEFSTLDLKPSYTQVLGYYLFHFKAYICQSSSWCCSASEQAVVLGDRDTMSHITTVYLSYDVLMIPATYKTQTMW